MSLGKKQAYLKLKRKALDPYKAAFSAKYTIEINMAFYRLCDHFYKYNINYVKCGVYSQSAFFLAGRDLSAVSHTKTPSRKQIAESMEASEKAMRASRSQRSLDDRISLLNAARFHSQSLDSDSSENQLLDLWAIFESTLDISNKHTSDRIAQVCMYLVPILKRRYIYSLFSQLTSDIRTYSETEFLRIVGNISTEAEHVEKVCKFVLLDKFENERNAFLANCESYPLLKERMEYYHQSLHTPFDVYNFVEKHAVRVKWQVMRIYRNRNLIIHNGESMPYLELLIENLHSYVDDFLTYVLHSFSEGHDINSMCQMLFAKECDWVTEFSNRKAEMNETVIEKILSM